MTHLVYYTNLFGDFAFLFSIILSVWGFISNFINHAKGTQGSMILILTWAIILSYSILHFVKIN